MERPIMARPTASVIDTVPLPIPPTKPFPCIPMMLTNNHRLCHFSNLLLLLFLLHYQHSISLLKKGAKFYAPYCSIFCPFWILCEGKRNYIAFLSAVVLIACIHSIIFVYLLTEFTTTHRFIWCFLGTVCAHVISANFNPLSSPNDVTTSVDLIIYDTVVWFPPHYC